MNHNDTLTRMRLANPADAADPDELAALRAVIEAEMAAPSGKERKPPLRWQPRPAVAVTVALVVTLALFLPLRYVGQGDGTADVAATTPTSSVIAPSTAPPASVAATPVLPLSVHPGELQWRRVDMPGLSGSYQWFDSVIAGGPGLIAVGSPNGEYEAFMWTSEDGIEWLPSIVEGAPNYGWAFDVTAGGPGYVAVGSRIWSSSDGVRWTNADVTGPIVGELRAVTVGGPGLVAVGKFGLLQASIYTSTDGLVWSLIPEEGAPEGAYESEITDIVAGGPGLVAVGHLGGIGAVWTSPDGFEWTRVPHDPEVFGYGAEGTELSSIAAGDAGFVAVGRVTDDNTMGIWRSDDGLTWSVVPLDPTVVNEHHALATVISTEQGFLAGGDGGQGDAGVWFSPDGISWTRLTGEALGGLDVEHITDLTVLGDSVIAVGVRFFETGSSGEDRIGDSEVVWIGEPAQE